MLIDDPKALEKSEMAAKSPLCNGKATGTPCKWYWLHIAKVLSNNPDILRQGEFHRACLISPGFPVEFGEEEIPHTCNFYEPRRHGITKLFKKYRYNPIEERYNPLTPEEYKKIQGDSSFTENLKHFQDQLSSFNPFGPADKSEKKATKSLPILQDEPEVSPEDITEFLKTLNPEKKDEE